MLKMWLYHDDHEARIVDTADVRALEKDGWRDHPIKGRGSTPINIPEFVEEVIPEPVFAKPAPVPPVNENDQKKIDAEKTLKNLKAEAKELGITHYWKMTVETLQDAITRAAEGA